MTKETVSKVWERMSPEQVRMATRDLQTERIDGRHANCVAGNGRRFFGLIHLCGDQFYLESKRIELVIEAMKKEGFVQRRNKDGVGCAWGGTGLSPAKTKAKKPSLTVVTEAVSPRRAAQKIKRGDKLLPIYAVA